MGDSLRPLRLHAIPVEMRAALAQQRHERGWSQADLGRQLGIPQTHISSIETGKIVPRFDTLLDIVRVLDHDLLLVPRALVPAVQSLIRNNGSSSGLSEEGEQSLYASDEPATEGEHDAD